MRLVCREVARKFSSFTAFFDRGSNFERTSAPCTRLKRWKISTISRLWYWISVSDPEDTRHVRGSSRTRGKASWHWQTNFSFFSLHFSSSRAQELTWFYRRHSLSNLLRQRCSRKPLVSSLFDPSFLSLLLVISFPGFWTITRSTSTKSHDASFASTSIHLRSLSTSDVGSYRLRVLPAVWKFGSLQASLQARPLSKRKSKLQLQGQLSMHKCCDT